MGHFFDIFALAGTIGALTACSSPDNRSFFEPLGVDADSVNAVIDRRWHDEFILDTDRISRLDSLAAASDNTQLRIRSLYWTAAVNMLTNEPFLHQLDSAITLCDSSRYPYDYARLIMLTEQRPTTELQQMKDVLYASRIFANAGDSLNLGIALHRLQHHLIEMGDTALYKQIGWHKEQLLQQIGSDQGVFQSKFDRMDLFYDRGGHEQEVALLADTLIAMPVFEENEWQRSVVYDARYEGTADPLDLYRAWATRDSAGDAYGTRTITAGHLALLNDRVGERDSALVYLAIFQQGLQRRRGDELKILRLAGKVFDRLGMPDSAARYESLAEREAYARSRKTDVASSIQALVPDILSVATLQPAEIKSNSPKFVDKILIVSVLSLIIFAVISRLKIRRRQKALLLQVEEDKRGVIDQIRGQLSADFDLHEVETLFARYAPGFESRLRDAFDGITPTELRLARLSLLRLDIKQMAALLSIAPESVKKARNRLRHRLGLDTAADLGDFLLRYL